jgi:hypothetical protein
MQKELIKYAAIRVNESSKLDEVRKELLTALDIKNQGVEVDYYSVVAMNPDLGRLKGWIKVKETPIQLTHVCFHPEGCIALRGTCEGKPGYVVNVILWMTKWFAPSKLTFTELWSAIKSPIDLTVNFGYFDGKSWMNEEDLSKLIMESKSERKEYTPVQKAVYAIKKFLEVDKALVKSYVDHDGHVYLRNPYSIPQGERLLSALNLLINSKTSRVEPEVSEAIYNSTKCACKIIPGEIDSIGWRNAILETPYGRIVFG